MVFKAHELPQKYKTTGISKAILVILAMFYGLLIISLTVTLVIESSEIINPICYIILPHVLLATIFITILNDMKKAFVEIRDEKITVVNYYFGIKCKKVFSLKDIITAEEITGYSMKVHGYRFSGPGFYDLTYLVFRGKNKKYLFKLICSEKTKNYFRNFINN